MIKSKPWLSRYDKGVPYSLQYPDICVHEYLAAQAQAYPKRIVIIYGESCIDYQTLHQKAIAFSKQLIGLGLKPGDRVGLCLPNSTGFIVAFFGVLMCGGVVAAMNPLFPKRELEFQVKTAEVRFIITDETKEDDFLTIELSQPASIFRISQSFELLDPRTGASFTSQSLNSPENPIISHFSGPHAPAVLQFSGGTTGVPKAAIGTHRNLVANVTQFKNWLVNLDDGKETYLIAIPLYHVYGLVLGLLLGIATGATLVLLQKPGDVDEMLHAITKYPVSYFPAVPSIFNLINNHPGVKRGDYKLNCIKACISGSAPLMEAVRENFEKLTGASLVEGYGLSEAPTATHCNPILGEKRAGSIGLPLPDVDCRIVSLANNQVEMPIGEEGELLIRGPQVMPGYFNHQEESSALLEGGWLRTGDIARMDAEGYFYLSGRSKDLIKVHGMQVWPTEVEQVLSEHPLIKECAVAGVPDEKSGERVKAWLVLQDGHEMALDNLRQYCQGKLAAYKIPVEISICASLPKTAVGKVLRRELVREHLERK
jgi:long-chain acyl-CoA synthetase